MKKLYVYRRKSKIILFNGEENEVIFNLNEYKDVVNNLETDKYSYFDIVKKEYGVEKEKEIKEKFLYLFNFILVNNISNYIVDKYIEGNFYQLSFDEFIKENKKQVIKLSGVLDIVDVMGDVITCLINTDEYLNGKLKMDYEKVNFKDEVELKDEGLGKFFYYEPSGVSKLKNKLKEDLVAFKYVKEKNRDKDGRFILPVYIDEEKLKNKGLENYGDFIVNWLSLSYLHMIEKIHDYFFDYYELSGNRGLVYDDLTVALIGLLSAEIEDYPKGLNKSIEVGRETSGKCYFIDSVVKPISLTQDLAMILQGKDAFGVVTKIMRSNR
ncbi:hypothetical protein [Anaerosphaera multitolerans]|uniref:Uncharacterized protein n=1 Tax=Anaerosphaera multitolerans TaxID=2487351 RepID=A0A437S917_9FIRM|nr:hypothetical protein [Anaerosphaera multitolerans]RVU55610.1 hypothetical protein EF514_02450 [Anaerosphaera multitolerans]